MVVNLELENNLNYGEGFGKSAIYYCPVVVNQLIGAKKKKSLKKNSSCCSFPKGLGFCSCPRQWGVISYYEMFHKLGRFLEDGRSPQQ